MYTLLILYTSCDFGMTTASFVSVASFWPETCSWLAHLSFLVLQFEDSLHAKSEEPLHKLAVCRTWKSERVHTVPDGAIVRPSYHCLGVASRRRDIQITGAIGL